MAVNIVNKCIRDTSRSILRHDTRFTLLRNHKFSTSNTTGDPIVPDVITKVSLSQPLPGFPKVTYATVKTEDYETEVTRLKNGLRVASVKKFGQFCTVGVAIDSGSRYEVSFPSGLSHFMEKLAFCSTKSYGSRDQILQDLEKFGGICDAQGSRDTLIYAANILNSGLETIVKILSEVILHPKLTPEELEVTKQTIKYELDDINIRPDQEPLLLESIHAAAYRSNTLGLPKICPLNSIPLINQKILYTYMKAYHKPERMVLAGVGLDHEQLVELAQKYFVETTPIWSDMSIDDVTPDNSLAQYTGGLEATEKDLSNVSLGPTPIPEVAHVVLGLESCSHSELDDFIPACVLNMLMGGGGSFSAGGPGKGMYTRLYTHVLNRYHWMTSATAYNHAYSDSGLFCIHASSHPKQLRDLVNVIVKEAFNMYNSSLPEVELKRAKSQLSSMLLMNLESRPVIFEDVARQVLSHGLRRNPKFFMDKIAAVTEDDIKRVACRLLKSKPSVAALGDLKQLPPIEDFETALTSKDGHIPKRFTLFR